LGERYVYVAADAYQLPFVPGLFDAVTTIRVLHHLADPLRALSQFRQVLRPGGAFILEYANKHNLKAILRYLLGRQSWNPFSLEPIEFATLNYDFHPQAIRSWLGQAGFSVKRQLTVSHFRVGLLKRWLPVDLLVAMDSVAQRSGDWWQLSPSVFVLAQAAGDSPIAQPGTFFRCPACGHYPLQDETPAMRCPACSRHWLIQDGIYDFRVKETSATK
jgi:SAM-dependent methyltransferase